MADVKKIATRESYGNALAACGEKYPNLVVLDADRQALQRQVSFRRHFHRHIDCGIAECNMTWHCSRTGYLRQGSFISSFAMFAAGRNF